MKKRRFTKERISLKEIDSYALHCIRDTVSHGRSIYIENIWKEICIYFDESLLDSNVFDENDQFVPVITPLDVPILKSVSITLRKVRTIVDCHTLQASITCYSYLEEYICRRLGVCDFSHLNIGPLWKIEIVREFFKFPSNMELPPIQINISDVYSFFVQNADLLLNHTHSFDMMNSLKVSQSLCKYFNCKRSSQLGIVLIDPQILFQEIQSSKQEFAGLWSKHKSTISMQIDVIFNKLNTQLSEVSSNAFWLQPALSEPFFVFLNSILDAVELLTCEDLSNSTDNTKSYSKCVKLKVRKMFEEIGTTNEAQRNLFHLSLLVGAFKLYSVSQPESLRRLLKLIDVTSELNREGDISDVSGIIPALQNTITQSSLQTLLYNLVELENSDEFNSHCKSILKTILSTKILQDSWNKKISAFSITQSTHPFDFVSSTLHALISQFKNQPNNQVNLQNIVCNQFDVDIQTANMLLNFHEQIDCVKRDKSVGRQFFLNAYLCAYQSRCNSTLLDEDRNEDEIIIHESWKRPAKKFRFPLTCISADSLMNCFQQNQPKALAELLISWCFQFPTAESTAFELFQKIFMDAIVKYRSSVFHHNSSMIEPETLICEALKLLPWQLSELLLDKLFLPLKMTFHPNLNQLEPTCTSNQIHDLNFIKSQNETINSFSSIDEDGNISNLSLESNHHDLQSSSDFCRNQGKREFIDKIRLEKFGITPEFEIHSLLKDTQVQRQARSLVKLSEELYSSDSHFIYELLQNADDSFSRSDNSCTPQAPVVAIIISEDFLLHATNEIGFTADQVWAICDVGCSTKTGNNYNDFIGEKGIGFKSVFKVSKAPQIHSNGFHIVFDTNKYGSIGQVIPEYVEESVCIGNLRKVLNNIDSSVIWNTLIYLPFRTQKSNALSFKTLINILPEAILFLNHVNHVYLFDYSRSLLYSFLKSRISSEFTKISTFVNNCKEAIDEIVWICVGKCSETDKMKILNLAFRLPSFFDLNSTPQTSKIATDSKMIDILTHFHPNLELVYCHLPLRSYGLRFIVQYPFRVNTSRQDIDCNDSDNLVAILNIPALLPQIVQVFEQLPISSIEFAYFLMLKYLPIFPSDAMEAPFHTLKTSLRVWLKSKVLFSILHSSNQASTIVKILPRNLSYLPQSPQSQSNRSQTIYDLLCTNPLISIPSDQIVVSKHLRSILESNNEFFSLFCQLGMYQLDFDDVISWFNLVSPKDLSLANDMENVIDFICLMFWIVLADEIDHFDSMKVKFRLDKVSAHPVWLLKSPSTDSSHFGSTSDSSTSFYLNQTFASIHVIQEIKNFLDPNSSIVEVDPKMYEVMKNKFSLLLPDGSSCGILDRYLNLCHVQTLSNENIISSFLIPFLSSFLHPDVGEIVDYHPHGKLLILIISFAYEYWKSNPSSSFLMDDLKVHILLPCVNPEIFSNAIKSEILFHPTSDLSKGQLLVPEFCLDPNLESKLSDHGEFEIRNFLSYLGVQKMPKLQCFAIKPTIQPLYFTEFVTHIGGPEKLKFLSSQFSDISNPNLVSILCGQDKSYLHQLCEHLDVYWSTNYHKLHQFFESDSSCVETKNSNYSTFSSLVYLMQNSKWIPSTKGDLSSPSMIYLCPTHQLSTDLQQFYAPVISSYYFENPRLISHLNLRRIDNLQNIMEATIISMELVKEGKSKINLNIAKSLYRFIWNRFCENSESTLSQQTVSRFLILCFDDNSDRCLFYPDEVAFHDVNFDQFHTIVPKLSQIYDETFKQFFIKVLGVSENYTLNHLSTISEAVNQMSNGMKRPQLTDCYYNIIASVGRILFSSACAHIWPTISIKEHFRCALKSSDSFIDLISSSTKSLPQLLVHQYLQSIPENIKLIVNHEELETLLSCREIKKRFQCVTILDPLTLCIVKFHPKLSKILHNIPTVLLNEESEVFLSRFLSFYSLESNEDSDVDLDTQYNSFCIFYLLFFCGTSFMFDHIRLDLQFPSVVTQSLDHHPKISRILFIALVYWLFHLSCIEPDFFKRNIVKCKKGYLYTPSSFEFHIYESKFTYKIWVSDEIRESLNLEETQCVLDGDLPMLIHWNTPIKNIRSFHQIHVENEIIESLHLYSPDNCNLKIFLKHWLLPLAFDNSIDLSQYLDDFLAKFLWHVSEIEQGTHDKFLSSIQCPSKNHNFESILEFGLKHLHPSCVHIFKIGLRGNNECESSPSPVSIIKFEPDVQRDEMRSNIPERAPSRDRIDLGYRGEELVCKMLLSKPNLSDKPFCRIVHVDWHNEHKETFLPYDITLTIFNENTNEHEYKYIEVKSTGVYGKDYFEFSINELEFAMRDPENYWIYRVYFPKKKADAIVERIENPVGELYSKQSKLYMYI